MIAAIVPYRFLAAAYPRGFDAHRYRRTRSPERLQGSRLSDRQGRSRCQASPVGDAGSSPPPRSARTPRGAPMRRLSSTATVSPRTEDRARRRSSLICTKPEAWNGFVTPDQLTLNTPPQHPFVLEIETEIDAAANTRLMGLYRSGSVYCTQCEAEGFRRITYFLDRPDVLSVYTVRLEAEMSEAPLLLSNGNKIAGGKIEGTPRHFAVWHDPFPKPVISVRAGRRRSRIDFRRIHDMFRPQGRARHPCRTWQGTAMPPMRWMP